MTSSSWLPIFRAVASDIRAAITPFVGSARGREVVGRGAGGDRTVYLDQLAEQVALRHLEEAYRSGFRFHLISEEIGERDFGGRDLILLDPVDGSVNAKQGLPYYAVVLAHATGDRIKDVRLGYVENLVTGDEFYAIAGEGAFRNGEPLAPIDPGFDGTSLPVVQLDAPGGADPRERALPIVAQAERVRQMGSAALNLCHTAAGGVTLQVTPLPVRAFDLAASLLVLREAGGVVSDFDGRPVDDTSVRLDSRTTLLASLSPEAHAYGLRLLAGHVRA